MSGSSDPLVVVNDLIKWFPIDRGRMVKAINGISFTIGRGEALALVGEFGSGKTTTGRCLMRLLEPTSGSIHFDSQDVMALDQRAFRRMRPQIQMVFQEPYDSLSPRMRIGRQIAEPLRMLRDLSTAERDARVVEALEMVRLGASALERYPHQFSAGEQQRIGIARALVTRPDLVVLDEPTSALDVSVRAEILDLLSDLQERLGLAYLFISHDLTAVRRVCDQRRDHVPRQDRRDRRDRADFSGPLAPLQPGPAVIRAVSGSAAQAAALPAVRRDSEPD